MNDTTKEFHFNPIEAECIAGQICVSYLTFTDFEKQVIPVKPEVKVEPRDLIGSDIIGASPKVLGIGKYLFSIPYWLLGGNHEEPLLDVDIAKYLKPKSEKPPVSAMTEKYRLLGYAIHNWELHTKTWIHAGELKFDEKSWKKFRDLALYKTLPFEHRAWGSNQHSGPWGCQGCPTKARYPNLKDLPYVTFFRWAVKEGHAPLLALLCAEGMSPFESEIKNGTLIACCYHDCCDIEWFGHGDLDDKSDVHNYLPEEQKSPLTTVCRRGHYEAAKILMDVYDGVSLLHASPIRDTAANGHEKF